MRVPDSGALTVSARRLYYWVRYRREDLHLKNHAAIADFLWKIADLIKDDYEAADYEDVILPFTLLRRLDCVLQPTREAAREAAGK